MPTRCAEQVDSPRARPWSLIKLYELSHMPNVCRTWGIFPVVFVFSTLAAGTRLLARAGSTNRGYAPSLPSKITRVAPSG